MPKRSSTGVRVFYPEHNREQLIKLLRERLALLSERLPLKEAVLFGSWASGRATAFSDIDLLVIYEGPPRGNAYRMVWEHLDLRGLQPHVYSEEEARQHEQTLQRMKQGGVTFF